MHVPALFMAHHTGTDHSCNSLLIGSVHGASLPASLLPAATVSAAHTQGAVDRARAEQLCLLPWHVQSPCRHSLVCLAGSYLPCNAQFQCHHFLWEAFSDTPGWVPLSSLPWAKAAFSRTKRHRLQRQGKEHYSGVTASIPTGIQCCPAVQKQDPAAPWPSRRLRWIYG